MVDVDDVALAALLHDVGKLLQRGSGMPRRATHGEFGHAFLSELGYSEAVCEAALRHHGRAKQGKSVSEARHPATVITYAADNLIPETGLRPGRRWHECHGGDARVGMTLIPETGLRHIQAIYSLATAGRGRLPLERGTKIPGRSAESQPS